jgi:hypothetical protein
MTSTAGAQAAQATHEMMMVYVARGTSGLTAAAATASATTAE